MLFEFILDMSVSLRARQDADSECGGRSPNERTGYAITEESQTRGF
jgi:hypothetical protein